MQSLSEKAQDDNLSIDARIKILGKWIDVSSDELSKKDLFEAIGVGKTLLSVCTNPIHLSNIHFFIANAHLAVRMITTRDNDPNKIQWENKELEQELIHLRIAFSKIRDTPIDKIGTDLPFRVATNLGNALNHIGRFSEALEFWDYVLARSPNFGMANGNRGLGLYYYTRLLYDPGHRVLFLMEARSALEKAIEQHLESNATDPIAHLLKIIDGILPNETNANVNDFSLGRSLAERNYRKWVMDNRLFINPLNDLGELPIAATDVFTLPSIVLPISEPPHLYGLFNQIKQEFVSARFLLFQGIVEEQKRCHFSDRNVLLFNTLDYPIYSLKIENVKIAYLSAYSVLDKIAFLLNHYYKLGIPERKVSFRNIWYETKGKKRKLHNKFSSSKNWPLRGLFWLSKDFYDENADFKDSIDPDAKELNLIRNHIAHKYLKVHDDIFWHENHDNFDFFVDRLCLSIRRDELHRKTLKLFKLVRSAMLYCSIAIHFEESLKKLDKEEGFFAPISLGIINDKWKT